MTFPLRPFSTTAPLNLDETTYQHLVNQKNMGWSQCQSIEEVLAKRHYLYQGFKSDKIDESTFHQRDLRLVEAWVFQASSSPKPHR